MKKVFPIILEKGDIFKQLNAKKKEFIDSDYTVAAIDLTNASVPNSTQLGEITVIIKTSNNRNGSTFIYTDNEDALDLLDQVHFSSIASVLKDKTKFDEIMNGEIKTTEIPKIKKIIPPENRTKLPTNSNVNNKKVINTNPLIVAILIVNLLISLGAILYAKMKTESSSTVIKAIIKNDKELNEKINDLTNKIKELELINENSN